jgi:hypothetical protein
MRIGESDKARVAHRDSIKTMQHSRKFGLCENGTHEIKLRMKMVWG